MRRAGVVWLALAAGSSALAAGCFSPRYHNGDLHCEASATPCPDGYHCAVDHTCWQNGHDPPRLPAHLSASGGGGVGKPMTGLHQVDLSVGQPLVGAAKAMGDHGIQLGVIRSAVTK